MKNKEFNIKTDEAKLVHKIIIDNHYRQWQIFNCVFNSQHTIMDAAREIAKCLEFSSNDNECGTNKDLNKAYVAHFIETFVPGMVKLLHEEEFYIHPHESKNEFFENIVSMKFYLEKGYLITDLTDSDWENVHNLKETRQRLKEELKELSLKD